MTAASPTLLPPNASALEREIEAVFAARLARLAAFVVDIEDPQACPAALLPWLAWALSVDVWNADWPVSRKRAVVAAALDVHRLKGTVAGVRAALRAVGARVDLAEWFQYGGAPYTARARIYATNLTGAPQLSPGVIAELRAAIRASAPVRTHLQLEFGVDFQANLRPRAAVTRPVTCAQSAGRTDRPQLQTAGCAFGGGVTRPILQARHAGAAAGQRTPSGFVEVRGALTRPVVQVRMGGQLRKAA